MTKPNDPQRRVDDPAEEAIATVLRAEREAHQAVERSQVEAGQLAENARSSARSVADRTERRVRVVVGAFERELAHRLAEIDAEAARIATPHELTASELGALERAVNALARELTGARP
jgi:HAMP domain-containing protein